MRVSVEQILQSLNKKMNLDTFKKENWPNDVLTMIGKQSTHKELDAVLEVNKLMKHIESGATKPAKVRVLFDWLRE